MSEDAELIIDRHGSIVVATLNRPKALNALTTTMVIEFAACLRRWAADPAITAVVVKGGGDKAFCAGGDIRQLYDAKAIGPVPTDFFASEYAMNSLIHHFPKPYIAVLNGVTMGGGVGISASGRYRIATERTLWAMPETGIGLFPDVGGSWFLPRLPGKIGLYLGLTGARLTAPDLIYCGLATHYMPTDGLDVLIEALKAEHDFETALAQVCAAPGPAPLAEVCAQIDRLFSGDSVEAILSNLAADDSDWAKAVGWGLQKKSPTSLKLAFAAYHRGRGLSFDDVMRMEFRVVSHLMQGEDFFEGVRALLVDRDNAPKWTPATVGQVADSTIDAYFAPLKTTELAL